jgi:serine/threonine protein phosphatase PrpC
VYEKVPQHEDWSAFLLFNGHGGSAVAKHCAKTLFPAIVRHFHEQHKKLKGLHPTPYTTYSDVA